MLYTPMGLVSPQQSSPGDTIEADDINTPVNQLAAVINGSIETANIADNAITTSKIADDSVTAGKIDWATTGANGGIWWEELGRTTLSVAGDTISLTSIPARKYLSVFVYGIPTGGTISSSFRFNNDSGANYSYRNSSNGGADGTAVSQTSGFAGAPGAAAPFQVEAFITNVAAQEKLVSFFATSTAASGAGTAPDRLEGTAKWANTADQITRIDVINGGAGDFAIGSEMVVLGHN